MNTHRIRWGVSIGTMCLSISALAQTKPFEFTGAPCVSPPPLHCPDENCPGDRIINEGNVVEMKTRRTFFLDYPCDLKPDEKVTFVLSLHGGGSYGNWQRNYFPLFDQKDKYRLVIATPNSPTRVWSEADDQYLQNIVTYVYDQLGKDRIKAFWLAGHSQGGQTSNRLLLTDFFKERLTGWVSLSGGRLGSKREDIRAPIPGLQPTAPGGAPLALAARAEELPGYPFSHIYETGENELTPAGIPQTSKWAEKLKCGPREPATKVSDAKAGYVYDGSGSRPSSKVWGGKPAPGSAEIFVYPKCEGGRVVADIVRLGKGHTEGLEPNVTEAIVKLTVGAKIP
jgi:hypothetical protein